MRTLLGILLASAGGLLVSFSLVQAAGFTVTPMIEEVVLGEGETSKSYLATVTNETDAVTTFEISVIDFESLDESGGVAFLGRTEPLEQKYALASWVRPEASELTLGPGEERSIRVWIENRESLSPGGHYGALVFKNVSPSRSGVPTVAINQILSSLVLVKKTGGAVYDLELVSVEHRKRWVGFDAMVTPRFKNPGNVHVVPRGEARVSDPFGRLVYRGVVNEGSAIILPETFRAYPLKLFAVEKAILPGYYALELDYRYDGRDEKEHWSERFLFVPPLFWMILVVSGTLITILIFWRYRRRGGTVSG